LERLKEEIEHTMLGMMFIGIYRCGKCKARIINRCLYKKDRNPKYTPFDLREFTCRFGPVEEWHEGELRRRFERPYIA